MTTPSLPWTPEELMVLKEQYPKLGLKACASLLKRPQSTVYYQARRLGLRVEIRRSTYKKWTEDEDRIIEENYPTLGRIGTAELLPGRTISATKNRAMELRIRLANPQNEPDDYQLAIRALGEAVKAELDRKPNSVLQRGFIRALKYQTRQFFIDHATRPLTEFFAECERIGTLNPQPSTPTQG